MAQIPNVSLTLESIAENVLLARQALNGVAQAAGLDDLALNDVSTAMTEACNNVVAHAYGGGVGPLEVDITLGSGVLTVIVADRGAGMHARADAEEAPSAGLGLPVMLALARSVQFSERAGGGTEVRMEFAAAEQGSVDWSGPAIAERAPMIDRWEPDGADRFELSLGPEVVARAVLPRVLAAIAARARFTTDGISDARLLADAILEHADESLNVRALRVLASFGTRDIRLLVGPLAPRASGSGAELLTSVFVRPLAELQVSVAPDDAGEMLAVRMTAER